MITIQLESTPLPFRTMIEKALDGENVIITHLGEPIIKWVVLNPTQKKRIPGSAQQFNIKMEDDFDDALPDFAEYMP